MTKLRCLHDGCSVFVTARQPRCPRHRPIQIPAQLAASSTPFEKALDAGNLRELHDTGINVLIRQAATDVARKGVVDELGVLRIVLTRLVTEESDLGKLTSDVTRVVSVALQAAKTQHLLKGQATEEVTGAVRKIRDEIQEDNDATVS